jgi:hypothetical protein
MNAFEIAATIGDGAQLFRVRKPDKYFLEHNDLPGIPELWIDRRRVWQIKDSDFWYALLSIPFKNIEDILVRAPDSDWQSWDWKNLADIASGCRWRGSDLDSRYVL